MSFIYSKDVAIIILNYNNPNDTILCVNSIKKLKYKPSLIIIVDNNSSDNSVNIISREFLKYYKVAIFDDSYLNYDNINQINFDIYILKRNINDGYGAGNNVGIRFAHKIKSVKAFWILNNDTIVYRNSLREICKRYNKYNNPCIIGSTLLYTENPRKIQATGGSKVFLPLGITKQLYNNYNLELIKSIPCKIVEEKLSDIIGASIFIHKDVISRIGYFREDFFLYLEETEYCLRAKKYGIKLLWAKNSIVKHKEGATTKSKNRTNRTELYDYLMLRNRAFLVKEYAFIMTPILVLSYIGVYLKRILRNQRYRLLLVFIALYHGLTGRMGKP